MEGKNNMKLRDLTLSAMFLAAGQVLPFITGNIPSIGRMLCPMHIPVLLCGFFVGGPLAALVGAICPLLRSVLFGMPVLFPSAVCMAFELMTYGFVCGFLYRKKNDRSLAGIYFALIAAMLAGRIVWGIASVIFLGIQGTAFTASAFLAGAFTNAIPGILLQLILIPPLVKKLDPYRSEEDSGKAA